MAFRGEVEATESVTPERIGATLQHDTRRLVELHHILDDWFEYTHVRCKKGLIVLMYAAK